MHGFIVDIQGKFDVCLLYGICDIKVKFRGRLHTAVDPLIGLIEGTPAP